MTAEQRHEIRRTFLPDIGHLVETVPVGAPLNEAQAAVALPPVAPAVPVQLTVADIPMKLARKVIEQAGLVVVPLNFLTPEQLAELNKTPEDASAAAGQTAPGAPGAPQPPNPPHEKAHKLPVEQMVERVKLAKTFNELNALMADETRKTVITAAEVRAEELKKEGAK